MTFFVPCGWDILLKIDGRLRLFQSADPFGGVAGKGTGRRVQYGFADPRPGTVPFFQGYLFTLFGHQQGRIDGAMKAQTGPVRFFSYNNAIHRSSPAAIKDNFPLNRLSVNVCTIAFKADACFRDIADGAGELGNRMVVIGSLDEKGM